MGNKVNINYEQNKNIIDNKEHPFLNYCLHTDKRNRNIIYNWQKSNKLMLQIFVIIVNMNYYNAIIYDLHMI